MIVLLKFKNNNYHFDRNLHNKMKLAEPEGNYLILHAFAENYQQMKLIQQSPAKQYKRISRKQKTSCSKIIVPINKQILLIKLKLGSWLHNGSC